MKGLFIFLVVICVYFLPTIVAVVRKHRQTTAICILNLFAGWSIIGWIAAIVWASTEDRKIV